MVSRILDHISAWLTNLRAFLTGGLGDKKPKKPWWWIDAG